MINHGGHRGHGERLRELAQVSVRLVELARWREVLRAGGDSAKKITSRMRLSETRPHLLQPDVWTKGRGTTVSEMLKFIPEQVRVDRPYPQWAEQISKNARINDIQVSGVHGLGSSALALKTKGDQTLKIQTLPFSRNRFDIATSEIGTVQVPKHRKAPDGKLHIGMQPTASVNSHDNYVPAMLYKSRMKKQGFSPGEFKTENFGFVRGKMKYIDADGSFRLKPAKPTESFVAKVTKPAKSEPPVPTHSNHDIRGRLLLAGGAAAGLAGAGYLLTRKKRELAARSGRLVEFGVVATKTNGAKHGYRPLTRAQCRERPTPGGFVHAHRHRLPEIGSPNEG
jgi:hypothetical protein